VSAVPDLRILDGSAALVAGVGEEHLVAHAFVLAEEGELGAGMRAFAAHDQAGAVRVAGKIDQVGQFGDLCPLAK
jgi:hypothetical protein